ncbi:MAG: DUF3854 domain-containing protein [Pyrinomonadaceae bacterium]
MLRDGSGLTDDVIRAREYRTITDARELASLGFTLAQQITPGLWIPGFAPDGSNGFGSYCPDFPRQRRSSKGELRDGCIKYETPKGTGIRLDTSPLCLPLMGDPNVPLWITEGAKKCDALTSHGLCAISLNGVYGFKGKNQFGGITLLADFDHIALKGREVRLVFDSDVMVNPSVSHALERLTEHVQRKGAHVSHVYLPGGKDTKVGVDDFLLAHTVEELEALVDAPRPQIQPAEPIVELLDERPAEIRRPLTLIDGHPYTATWLYVKTTTTESLDKSGNIIKHNPPIETTGQRMFIVRDDGVIFGEGGTYPIDELELNVRLHEIPPVDKLWSARGVKAYRSGERPKPADVFNQVVDCVDRFIDFNKSLADQRTMAEMVACYILATWFLDAFNVAGNIWPNGEKGSGKTQLLITVAKLAYLGQVILASASFAALRDMANYGAFLAFDDAENLSDPKKTDPDKRTLLLAGNRRGNTVAIKVQGPDKTWITEYVDTYSPRAFSAIRLPDSTLASRTIIVPLIRTPDRYRANADPSDDELWPHDQRKLIDDLWALSLANLSALPPYEKLVNERASLTGRSLEPWRSLLAVAMWLDENGVSGLWERMERLSVSYQGERGDMESGDLTVLVIRALCRLVGCDLMDVKDVSDIKDVNGESGTWKLRTSDITEKAKLVAQDLELDIDQERITERRIGRVLGGMRFQSARKAGERRFRGWIVTVEELRGWVCSQGLIVDVSRNFTDSPVTNVHNVHNVLNVHDSSTENGTDSPDELEKYAATLDYYAGTDRESPEERSDVRRVIGGVPQWECPDSDQLERM